MRVLTFSGLLTEKGLELDPGFVVDGEPTPADGDLVIEVLGRRGTLLATTRVVAEDACTPGADVAVPTAKVAVGLVPFPRGASGLRVSLDGVALLERGVPDQPLEIEVEWPKALSSGPNELAWRASAEGCLAVLGFSADDGKTWAPLSLPTAEPVIIFDGTHLPGRLGTLELRVSDGLRTVAARSERYDVDSKGWVLWLLSPPDGAELPADRPVQLAGQAFHVEERVASFELDWSSSVDGPLGAGARLDRFLSPGEHRLTATAEGQEASVTVTVSAD
jgi:hypothetical protein